jgi:hypothetical protein
MRTFLALVFLSTGIAFAAEPEEKDVVTASVFAKSIAEFRLPNGTVFRNVTLVRYEKEKVELKTSAGQTSLAYSYFPEPMRARMIAERDEVLSQKTTTQPIRQQLLEARRSSRERAISNNLRQIAAAAELFFLMNGVKKVKLEQLVGSDDYIKKLISVDGEDYSKLDLTAGVTPWKIVSASGITVT